MEWPFLVGWGLGLLNFFTTLVLYFKQKKQTQSISNQNIPHYTKYYNVVDFRKPDKKDK